MITTDKTRPGGHGNLGNGFKGRAARPARMMRSRDRGYMGSGRKPGPTRAAGFGRGWR